MDNGIMLFSPDHALRIAAEAIGKHAESTDMAVGIVLGIRSMISEWNKLTSGELAAQRPTEPVDSKAGPVPAIPRPRSVAKVNA
jgi:hypothetical protein